jgi:hypothetical protein
LFRNWRAVAYSGVFAAIFCVWLVGVTVTTSYGSLLPLWVALGCLTVWPDFCEHSRRAKAPAALMPPGPIRHRRPWGQRPSRRVSLLPAGPTGASTTTAAALLADRDVSRIGDGGEGASQ